MRYIISSTTNPYFNLATEEYLLNNESDNITYIYRNDAAIIIGKNQNTHEEINYDYVTEHKIPVVRRLSGGGAVFHDLGNLNFCFITDKKNGQSFQDFTLPIVDFLQSIHIDATFSGRNDLLIDEKKFSGNAQYHFKNRLLHHGTLLFSSNMKMLTAALKVKESKFEGKSVKSVKSRVTNIESHLKDHMTIESFTQNLFDFLYKGDGTTSNHALTDKEVVSINELVKSKYETFEWVYSKSPKSTIIKEFKYTGGNVTNYINVSKGIIENIAIKGDFFSQKDIGELEKKLTSLKYDREAINDVLSTLDVNEFLIGLDQSGFLESLF